MSVRGFVVSLFAAAALLLVPAASAQAGPGLAVPSGLNNFGEIYLNTNSERTFSLYSNGSDPITIGSATVHEFANNSEYFTITDDGCSGQTLDPQESCQLKVKFAPTVVGFRYTSIMIAHDGIDGGSSFGVDGTGINPGISVNPTGRDFGTVEMSFMGSPVDQTFTVSNDGTTDLELFSINVIGDDADDFDVVNSPDCSAVTPGGTCEVKIRFAPTGASGDRSANLVLGNNTMNENPVTIPLTGTATLAHMTPNPTSIDFGDADPYDGESVTETIELQSDGTADLIAGAFFGNPSEGPPTQSSGPFSVNGNACQGTEENPVLTEPGESCDLTVTFDPTVLSPGQYSRTLYVASNGNVVEIPLTGRITYATAAADSALLDYGYVAVNTTESATFNLTSNGTAPLQVDPEITGDGASSFSVDLPANCATIKDGQSCQVTVDFTPGAAFNQNASLELSGNFPTQAVALYGYGITAFVNAPFDISLPETVVGEKTVQPNSLISNGDVPFTLEELAVDGPDKDSFSVKAQDGGCTELVRGEECGFEVTYAPTSAGFHEAEIKIIGNLETQTIPLEGSARNPTPAKLALKLTGPGKVKRGKTLTLTAKLTNSGEDDARNVVLKTTLPKKLATAVKAIKVPEVAGGKTVVRKIKVKVKRSAKKGKKLKVRAIASAKGIKSAAATRTARVS